MLSELKASVIGSLLITLPLSPSLKKEGRKEEREGGGKKGGKEGKKKTPLLWLLRACMGFLGN